MVKCVTILGSTGSIGQQSLDIIDNDYILQLSHIGFLKAVLSSLSINGDKKKEVIEYICSKNIDAIEILKKDNSLKNNPKKLWELIPNHPNSHNSQMNVVCSLWNADLIVR